MYFSCLFLFALVFLQAAFCIFLRFHLANHANRFIKSTLGIFKIHVRELAARLAADSTGLNAMAYHASLLLC